MKDCDWGNLVPIQQSKEDEMVPQTECHVAEPQECVGKLHVRQVVGQAYSEVHCSDVVRAGEILGEILTPSASRHNQDHTSVMWSLL